jgi:hypothetical protein
MYHTLGNKNCEYQCYQWLRRGFFELKMNLFHTPVQLIIPLICVLSVNKSQFWLWMTSTLVMTSWFITTPPQSLSLSHSSRVAQSVERPLTTHSELRIAVRNHASGIKKSCTCFRSYKAFPVTSTISQNLRVLVTEFRSLWELLVAGALSILTSLREIVT